MVVQSPSPALCRAGLALALLLASACGTRPAPQRPRRIVLVTLDTLRYDAFDGEDASMPLTAALAAERGELFERFYSATSSTQPTHATLFTGLHPWAHGVARNGAVLAAELPTLAELLQQTGYRTVARVASFPLAETFGFAQGFDEYLDDFERSFTASTWNGVRLEGGFYDLAGPVSASALELLDGMWEGDHFVWLHYFDAHAPYGDSEGESLYPRAILGLAAGNPGRAEESLRRARELYAADVAAMDQSLRAVLDRALADEERFETWIVLTADHGESFGEGGVVGHGNEPIPSQVHVPLVLIGPDRRARRRSDVAGSVDLFPTILAMAGVAPPPGTTGRDLLAPGDTPGLALGMSRTYAAPSMEQTLDGELRDYSEPRFFCVRGDEYGLGTPRSVQDLSGAVPPDAEGLRALFGKFRAELDSGRFDERLDRETQAALEALGYTR